MPVDVTEDFIHVRVRDPDAYETCRLTDFNDSLPNGVRAKYCKRKDTGEWEIQAFIFDKDKFSVSEAEKWVEEHKDSLVESKLEEGKRTLFMPLVKTAAGFDAVLSSNSVDLQGEIIGKEVLKEWAETRALPALLDHSNEMASFIGGWKDFHLEEDGERMSLHATPVFFSGEANPMAPRMQKLIEEATDLGIPVGVSIGAVPTEFRNVEIGGRTYKEWTKARLVESSYTPVPANLDAYVGMAKSLVLAKTLEKERLKNKEANVASKVKFMSEEKAPQEKLSPGEAPAEAKKEMHDWVAVEAMITDMNAKLDTILSLVQANKVASEPEGKAVRKSVETIAVTKFQDQEGKAPAFNAAVEALKKRGLEVKE